MVDGYQEQTAMSSHTLNAPIEPQMSVYERSLGLTRDMLFFHQ